MKNSMKKKMLTFAMAAAMAVTSVTIPSVPAEAASGKTVKSVKLKIGAKTVTNKKYTMTAGQKKKIKVIRLKSIKATQQSGSFVQH